MNLIVAYFAIPVSRPMNLIVVYFAIPLSRPMNLSVVDIPDNCLTPYEFDCCK
jgi:hypothetical protein